jgi:signal transduction histidine kinase
MAEAARHRTADGVRDLGRRLIDPLEHERRRLSRELHDGVCQRLAVLSAELALLREQPAPSSLGHQIDRLPMRSRHAGLSSCDAKAIVRLQLEAGNIVLSVIDEGRGFDPLRARHMSGVGLVSMRERARQVDGLVT